MVIHTMILLLRNVMLSPTVTSVCCRDIPPTTMAVYCYTTTLWLPTKQLPNTLLTILPCCALLLRAFASCNEIPSAQYGIPGRSSLDTTQRECQACTTQTTGYSFEWNLVNQLYAVKAISKPNASSSIDCLSEFAQMVDGAW